MSIEDLRWPPLPEHLAYHEAGHAVLQYAYGLGINYIAIEPDTTNWASWCIPLRPSAAVNYRQAIISGAEPTGEKPTEDEVVGDLAILIAGEIAAAKWASIEEDIPELLQTWDPSRHQELVESDPRHLETFQACAVALRFLDGDLEGARRFVVRSAICARSELGPKWPAVEALALALLADYKHWRALERSTASVQGALPAPKPARIIDDALLKVVRTPHAGEL